MPAAVQRKAIEASRQRLTLRVTCRMVPFMFSMMLVQARERRNSLGRPRRTTHRISSSPSRMVAAMPGHSLSSRRARLRISCSALAASSISQACRRAPGLRLLGQTLGNVAGLVNLAALDRRVLAKGAADRLGLGAVDDDQPHHRRIEAARDQVVEQRLNRGGVLGGPLDQPQRVLLARGVDARHQDQVLLDVQIWIANRSRGDRSVAIQSFSFALDRATNLRDTADFEVPSPLAEATSPSGRRTERRNRRVETLISIWFIAH